LRSTGIVLRLWFWLGFLVFLELIQIDSAEVFAKGKAPSSDGRYSQYQKAVSQAKAAQARNQTSSKLASNAQSSQNQAPQTLQQNQSVSIPKNQKAQPKPQPKNNTSTTQQQNTQPTALDDCFSSNCIDELATIARPILLPIKSSTS
jgi:hypothetical protein